MRLSFANQADDAPLSSSITTPTSSRLTRSNFSLKLSYHQITLVSLNYLITISCWYLWIILAPNHARISSYHWIIYHHWFIYHQIILISHHILSSSYQGPPPKSALVNFLHSILGCINSLSPHQGQMYQASFAGPQDWLHFLRFVCVHCCTVILSVYTTVCQTCLDLINDLIPSLLKAWSQLFYGG